MPASFAPLSEVVLGTMADVVRERRRRGTRARVRSGELGNGHPPNCSAPSTPANRQSGASRCRTPPLRVSDARASDEWVFAPRRASRRTASTRACPSWISRFRCLSTIWLHRAAIRPDKLSVPGTKAQSRRRPNRRGCNSVRSRPEVPLGRCPFLRPALTVVGVAAFARYPFSGESPSKYRGPGPCPAARSLVERTPLGQ